MTAALRCPVCGSKLGDRSMLPAQDRPPLEAIPPNRSSGGASGVDAVDVVGEAVGNPDVGQVDGEL